MTDAKALAEAVAILNREKSDELLSACGYEAKAVAPADVLERIAREQLSDPATDDLTVPLAIELAEMTTRALKAEAAVRAAAPAVGGEPVAWRWKPLGGSWQYAESDASFPDGAGTLQPLYAAQPASPLRGIPLDLARSVNNLSDYADDLDHTERPAVGDYDVTADIRTVCQALIDALSASAADPEAPAK